MTGVTQESAIFHVFEMFFSYHISIACEGEKDIPPAGCHVHGHDLITIHNSLESPVRINFYNDHPCSESRRSEGHSSSAPAISSYYDTFACDQVVGRSHYSIQYRLASSIPIIKKIFALCVIYRYNRDLQCIISFHGFESVHPCRGFLRPPKNRTYKMWHFFMQKSYHIGSIIYYDIRMEVKSRSQIGKIL